MRPVRYLRVGLVLVALSVVVYAIQVEAARPLLWVGLAVSLMVTGVAQAVEAAKQRRHGRAVSKSSAFAGMAWIVLCRAGVLAPVTRSTCLWVASAFVSLSLVGVGLDWRERRAKAEEARKRRTARQAFE